MKKRILAFILVLIMCAGLVGCDSLLPQYRLKNEESTATQSADETLAVFPSETPDLSGTEQPDSSASTPQDDATPTPDVKPTDAPAKESTISPVFYKVTDDKGNIVWLLGSIHVGREDFYPLPDYIKSAFESSDVLAVECDIVAAEDDISSLMSAMEKFLYTDGTTIEDHLSKETYDTAVKILKENNMYFDALDYYEPAFWSMLIDEFMYEKIDVKSDLGIDINLIKYAMKSKKEIDEIESIEFQYGMFGDFSEELQAFLIESSIEQYGDLASAKKDIGEMLDMWASGDEKAFNEYLAPEEIEDPEEALLYDEYTFAVETSRNATMTGYAVNALKSGKEVFICVGAAHVMGDSGMVARLRALGYTVELVR